MKDYSKTAPTFWTGETGRKIRAAGRDAQVVAFYLFTCPSSNWIGIFYLPLPTLCHEVGISLDEALAALHRLEEIDYAYYDHETETVWVPGTAKFQIGEELKPEDRRIAGIVKDVSKVARKEFGKDFYRRYANCYHLHKSTLPPSGGKPLASPLQAPSKPLRSPLQAPPKPVTEAVAVTVAVTETTAQAAGAAAVDPSPSEREAERLSELLRARIAVRDGHAKAAKLPVPPGWARDIEKLLRIDGRRPEDVEKVIAWCQQDGCFWAPNVLSGRTLREKFDTMWGQMLRDRSSGKPDTVGASDDPAATHHCRQCEDSGRLIVLEAESGDGFVSCVPWSELRETYFRSRNELGNIRRCTCPAGAAHADLKPPKEAAR